MTVYEGVPSIGAFLGMKLTNAIAKSRQPKAHNALNTARTWLQGIVKLVAHLAGFSLLTWAGFTFNMTAGLIVAGLSCFVFAWLMNDSDSQPAKKFVDPMASRR